jgi:hypothetical protein
MKKLFFISILSAVILLSTYDVSESFQVDSNGGHEQITDEAAKLKMQVHGGDLDFINWLYTNDKALNSFLTGAHDEDSTIPFNIPGVAPKDPLYGPNGYLGGWFFHFYNPYTKLGFGGAIPSILGPLVPIGGLTSAPVKAQVYVSLVKGNFCPAGNFTKLPNSKKQETYDILGRVMHLIQDMSSPSHVKGAWLRAQGIHGLFGPGGLLNTIYENYVANNWASIIDSETYKAKIATYNDYYESIFGNKLRPYSTMDESAKESYKFKDDVELALDGELYEGPLRSSAENLVPQAVLRTAGFIDAIYKCVKDGCDCDQPPRPNPDHPDDNFDVGDLAMKDTQFGMSSYELLDFYTRLALKKGNMAPIYMKQIIEIYAEGKALPADATDEQKNIIEQKFSAAMNNLNSQPLKDIETSPDVAILENGYYR